MSKRAANITKRGVQAVIENADEETLSTRALMLKQDSTKIITDPREYQLELFERAKTQNVIAVLDTGVQCKVSPFALKRLIFSRLRQDLDSCLAIEAHPRY